jgi:uncharacterized protein YbbC (DUF1343 family)
MTKLGIDQIESHLDLFKNKRVGLITNPTGLNSSLVSSVDILATKTNLVALFAPEHGVRGEIQAGVKVDDYIDEETNIMVYSLYGKNKKPSKELMDKIDIMAFDIQDVGARFYTFIYTMAYALMACKEHNKEMVVFDRPNPVNSETVEGTILDTEFRSFVGYYPIPQRYGLTIGELAHFFNEQYKINASLTVVEMKDYKRSYEYEDTLLPYILPSPNIPTVNTTFVYLATCIFEGTNLSEGRGTTKPFHIIGSPYFKANTVLQELSKHNLKGVAFRKLFFTPTFSKWKGELCEGIELLLVDRKEFEPVKTGFILFDIVKRLHNEFDFIPPFKKGNPHFIDFLNGSDFLRKGTMTLEEQLSKIKKDTNTFKNIKRRYEIYD